MCRLVAYLGTPILLEKIIVKPANSIIDQSLNARESSVTTNGDGFGLGWYTPSINWEPALFLSIFPAWNDKNLLNLSAKIESGCFFSHVRAASTGGVNPYNCHPFAFGRWMLMHNGQIKNFIKIKRHLRHLLDDDIYHWIAGETDSEHLFALFLQLAKGKDLSQLTVVAAVLNETFVEIIKLINDYGDGKGEPSYFNICLTDGERMVASRFCSERNVMPESLHYLAGQFTLPFEKAKKPIVYESVMVASEQLTEINIGWEEVPKNHFLLVDRHQDVTLMPMTMP